MLRLCLVLIPVVIASLIVLAFFAPVPVNAIPPQGFQKIDVLNPTTNLAYPVAFEFAPDGRMFVAEKSGLVVTVEKNGTLDSTPLLDIHTKVNQAGEHGLLGIAVDPHFNSTSPYVYLFYTNASPLESHVSRFTMMPNGLQLDPNSEVILTKTDTVRATYHQGGGLRVTSDGYLFATFGENAQQETGNATEPRNLSDIDGKLIRLFLNGTVPSDNPYVNIPGADPRIWATGFRNPYKMGILPNGIPIVGVVGQADWEDTDVAAKGLNFTWPLNGTIPDGPCVGCGIPGLSNPIYSYPHNTTLSDWLPGDIPGATNCIINKAFANQTGTCLSSAVTAGLVINTNNYPSPWNGLYFFGDYVRHFVRALKLDSDYSSVVGGPYTFDTSLGDVVDFRQGTDGNLYGLVITSDNKTGSTSQHGGTIFKYVYTPGSVSPPSVAATVNDTAGFAPLTAKFTVGEDVLPAHENDTWFWNFGDGSTSNLQYPIHTFTANGTYNVLVNVTRTNQTSLASAWAVTGVKVVVGQKAPNVFITAPINGANYNAGDTIQFNGSATDTNGNPITPDNLAWTVIFHHLTHIHPGPFTGQSGSSGNFTIPPVGEPSTITWYEIDLAATDSNGVTNQTTVFIYPRTGNLTFTTNTPGLGVTVNGLTQPSPVTTPSVYGYQWTIGAPNPQTFNNHNYAFWKWSDSLPLTHTISAPSQPLTTYTATFNNTGNADKTPPILSITSPVNKLNTTSTTVIVSGTASDNVKVQAVTYKIDGGALSNATTSNGYANWSFNQTLLGGTHTIQVNATDPVGNVATQSRTVTVQTLASICTTGYFGSAPSSSLDKVTFKTKPAGNPGLLVTINGTSCKTPFTIPLIIHSNWQISAPSPQPFPGVNYKFWTWADSPLQTRVVNIPFQAAKGYTATYNGTIDTTPPVITLLGSSTMAVQAGGTFTDPGVTVSDPDNTGLVANVTGTVNTGVIGTYTITYTASDPAGNHATPVTRTVNVVDTTPPSVFINSPTNSTMFGTPSFEVTGSASDNVLLKSVTYKVDNGPVFQATDSIFWQFTTPLLTNGVHNIHVNATDSSGNVATQTLQVTTNVVDFTPPTLTISSPANGTITNLSIMSFSGTDSDNFAVMSMSYKVDNGPKTPISVTDPWSFGSLTLSKGSHLIQINATDTVGNVATKMLNVTTGMVQVTLKTNHPTFFTTSLNGTQYLSDKAILLPINSHWQLSTANPQFLSGVSYNFTSWNIGGTQSQVITIPSNVAIKNYEAFFNTTSSLDHTPPTLVISSPANNSIISAPTVKVNGTATDNNAVKSVTWKLDNGAYSNATGIANWSFTTVPLSNGIHNIRVNATDFSSNVASQAIQVTVQTGSDSSPPKLLISSPANKTITNLNTMTVNGTATDNVAVKSVRWKVDAGAFSTVSTSNGFATWSFGPLVLSNGNHTFQVVANDTSDNVNSTKWQVTTGTVQVTLNTNHPPFTLSLNGTQYVSPRLILLPINSHWQLSTTNPQFLSGVSYNFTTWNIGGAQSQVITIPSNMATQIYKAFFNTTISLDHTPPTLVISSPANNTIINSATVAVSGTASDNNMVQSVTYKVDSGSISTATGTTSWSFTTAALSNGPHTIQVNATDPSGNVATKKLQVTIQTGGDTTRPSLIISSPANGTITNLTTLTFSGTSSDNVAVQSVKWNVDNGAYSTATNTGTLFSTWTFSPAALSNGVHTIRVNATDTSGNINSTKWQITTGTVKVTIQSNHASTITGSVNGTQYNISSKPVLLLPINSHWLISTTTPQPAGGTHTYTFTSWSDGGAISHVIAIPSNSATATYTASFKYQ